MSNPAPTTPVAIALPDQFAWLADAPLFIDADQVRRFYDAVVRPDDKIGSTKIETRSAAGSKLVGRGTIAAETTFPWVVKAKVEAGAERASEASRQDARTVELHAIDTPERQLVQLALHYYFNQNARLALPAKLSDEEWRSAAFISQLPRGLIFLDLPGHEEAKAKNLPDTRLIPTAAEFEGGKIELLFNKFKPPEGQDLPKYPDRGEDPAALRAARKVYWQDLAKLFSADDAMRIVEVAASGFQGVRWIDYRLPLTAEGDTLHLHVCPAGKYDVGVFAYNLVKRGNKHGLRLVGTLKSEPDMNVLAVYEK